MQSACQLFWRIVKLLFYISIMNFPALLSRWSVPSVGGCCSANGHKVTKIVTFSWQLGIMLNNRGENGPPAPLEPAAGRAFVGLRSLSRLPREVLEKLDGVQRQSRPDNEEELHRATRFSSRRWSRLLAKQSASTDVNASYWHTRERFIAFGEASSNNNLLRVGSPKPILCELP